MKKIVKAMSCVFLLAASASAMAQEKGAILVKAGYAHFHPVVSSGYLTAPGLPGSQVGVGDKGTLLVTGAYMFTDHLSAELYLGIPLKHKLYGEGSIHGVGAIGTVKQAPPTLFGQYNFFEPSSNFRPYVGLGIARVHFSNETGSAVLTAITNPGGGVGTTFQVNDAWGLVSQVGFKSWINKKWYLDVSVNKSFIKTKTTMSNGQMVDAKLNPVVMQASIGYHF